MKYSFENISNKQENKDLFEDNEIDNKKTDHNFEYLKPGIPKILSCIGTPAQFIKTEKNRAEFYEFYDSRHDIPDGYDIVDVNYEKSHYELENDGFKNPKTYSYVISPIDNFSKISKNYFNCIGFLAVGYKKETKENISFMSHQNPRYFLNKKEQYDSFKKDFESSLIEFKQLCEDKTIDAVVFGGNFNENDYKKEDKSDKKYNKMGEVVKKFFHSRDKILRMDYIRSERLLNNETKKILGFEPTFIVGPKTETGPDNVYFDNKNRRIYISRLEIKNNTTQSFSPSELEEYLKKS